jgi:chorismate mutase
MRVLAIRGATTVENNLKEEILKETAKLINSILNNNNINKEDIISIIFTMTKDLDAAYPSIAVREILNITDVPLLNFEEKYIVGSLQKCIRVLININTTKEKKDIQHIYQNEAINLRKDLIYNKEG